MMATGQGRFVWYELMTSDLAAAETFYKDVLGWTVADAGMPDMRYTIAKIGERNVAGLMETPPDVPPGAPPIWFGYIAVDDVDAIAQQVREAGGVVHREPTDIPGIGRFAVVADPQGARFMLFRGAGEPPPELAPDTAGDIGWRELHASDWKAAFAFYREHFGWTDSYAHDMGPMGVYQTFSIGETWSGGMMSSTQVPRPIWLYYFNVDGVEAAAARVTAAGGRVLQGLHEVPGGKWILHATDPQGAMFALTGSKL